MAKKTDVSIKTRSGFDRFCDKCFAGLDADKRVSITNSFLTDGIKKILSDSELTESLNALFQNNLNISETSRNTFVHRNTLVYRIEKIYRLTGLDVRKFDDAVMFRLCMWLKDR